MLPGTYPGIYVCMWGLYTLVLLLNSSCGATRYTRRNRHNQDHHTKSPSLYHVHQGRKGLQEGEDRSTNPWTETPAMELNVICLYLVRTSSRKVSTVLVRVTWCTQQKYVAGTYCSIHSYIRTYIYVHGTYHTARKCKNHFVFVSMYKWLLCFRPVWYEQIT